MQKKKKPRSLREALSGVLTEKELAELQTSYDSLGNIAVIEIPKKLAKKERKIAKALMEVNSAFKTVCRKLSGRKGKYRVQPLKVIGGKKSFLAHYRESGCAFEFDASKVFFSPRLSSERLRIAKQIKPGEVIGALFAGVGPYPIVFAKNSPMALAYAVELNPSAFKWLKKNIALNKAQEKIAVIKGDVKKVVPKKLNGLCDRVVMPLPHTGEDFLKEAFMCLKPSGGIIHFYEIVEKRDSFEKPLRAIRNTAKKLHKEIRVLQMQRVRDFSASKMQIVVDFLVK
ncbi:MAG: class I SAM-dependent methyltransferase family protein [Candidatus Diapherotrites archaeon]